MARVNGNQGIEDVFRDVLSGLKPVQEREVLDSNKLAVDALVAGDLSTYREVCTYAFRRCQYLCISLQCCRRCC